MKELTQIMFEIYKPYIKEDAWDGFRCSVLHEFDIENGKVGGDVEHVDTMYYPNSAEICKIVFRFKGGYPTYTLEPRRRFPDEKELSAEYDRLRKLLTSAEALQRAA